MDFSAFNPLSTNSLNLAARSNDTAALQRLLRRKNPNCTDNRGWTCLHEAAAAGHEECIRLILQHKECRPLAETFEGHTALYIACRHKAPLACTKLLLDSAEDIAQYASNEMVSPLHLACQQGDLELVKLLVQYDSLIDLQDFDGDTPLHDAVFKGHAEVSSLLLHTGAQAEKCNTSGMTPLHLACLAHSKEAVQSLLPFITDINLRVEDKRHTPLMLASRVGSLELIKYLIENKADPNVVAIVDGCEHTALTVALEHGFPEIFSCLLKVTDPDCIPTDIFERVFTPENFQTDIVMTFMESDLDTQFFREFVSRPQCAEILYPNESMKDRNRDKLHSSLNSFMRVAQYTYERSPEFFHKVANLLLMKGVSVNVTMENECPPLSYLFTFPFHNWITEMLQILFIHNVNVEYRQDCETIPDAVHVSLVTMTPLLPLLLPYIFTLEPEDILRPEGLKHLSEESTFRDQECGCGCAVIQHTAQLTAQLDEILLQSASETLSEFAQTQRNLRHLINDYTPEHHLPATLMHLCRRTIRQCIACKYGGRTTKQYFEILNKLPLPKIMLDFIRYIEYENACEEISKMWHSVNDVA